ncbi:MAG: protein kinase [Phycisphaerales bacterium]|nr:MAG: protein kinase [Phycisphaerales bacterium]
MKPPRKGDEPSSREDLLIEAARREVFGEGRQSTSEVGLNGKAGQDESVKSPPLDGDTAPTRPLYHSVSTIPRRIAHYDVKRVIASGGMGTVYEATQDHPRRTVAVKVMRHGITSSRAIRRFEFESQILARLQHPGIAHVYDAGWYEDGGERVPYFAMEYIPNARSVIGYADQKNLSLRERLKLFISVCEAVHHGHQRGVIHRDLKPGNILVNTQGQVKVIDFGVARCTDADLNLTAIRTSVGEMIGTLKYMSPEQCQADPQDLDIRSDIYSLGVLLYELLSGRPPYDLRDTPIMSAPRVICEETPTRLSSVSRSLRGDIETIVAKALEKDRSQRYQSALALAEDIGRYLNDEPIVARPPSAVYRFRKLVHRRRVPFGVAAALLVMVLVGGAREARAWNLRLENERLAAEAQREDRDRLATELVLAVASTSLLDWPNLPIPPDSMLETCNHVIELDEQNAGAYALRGRLCLLRGDNDSAQRDCTKALALDPDNFLALRTAAHLALKKGDFAEARKYYEPALQNYQLATDLPRDFHNRARMRRIDGEYDAAIEDHNRAVSLRPDYGLAWKGRGVTNYMRGDVDAAIQDLEHAASLPGDRAVQCGLWIWEMRMLRDAPGDREEAEDALQKVERAAEGNPFWEELIAVLRGRQTPDECLSPLEGSDLAQVCYYLGAEALVGGREEEAAEYFEEAADFVLRGQDEFDLARWHIWQLEAD